MSLYFNVSLFFVHVMFAFVKLALKSVEKKKYDHVLVSLRLCDHVLISFFSDAKKDVPP